MPSASVENVSTVEADAHCGQSLSPTPWLLPLEIYFLALDVRVSSDVHLWQYSSLIPLVGRCQSIEVHASTVFVGDVITSCRLLGTCRQLSLFSFAPLREAAAFPLQYVFKSHALASDLLGWRTSLLWKQWMLIVGHGGFHLWMINFEVRAIRIS